MADRAGDNPRSAADKERSRQASRAVSGKEAARGVGRTSTPPGRARKPQPAAGNGRRAASGAQPPGGGRGRQSQRRPGPRPGGGRPSGRPIRRQRRSRTALVTWIAVAVVLVVVGVVVGVSQISSTTGKSGIYHSTPVSATVAHEVTHVPASVFDTVGTGLTSAITPPRPVSGQPALTTHGKPLVFGLFGNYCPYCAVARWAIVTSFSRFGTWSGLKTMQSSVFDAYPATQTFDFNTVKYSSPYFNAQLLEMFGQEQSTPTHKRPVINKPTKAQQKLIAKYDSTPSSSSSGTIPFLDFGNKLLARGAPFNPQPFQGLSRATIAASLKNPNSPISKLVIGEANYLSASICAMDGSKPGAVCSSSGVQAAAKALGLKV